MALLTWILAAAAVVWISLGMVAIFACMAGSRAQSALEQSLMEKIEEAASEITSRAAML